ncbi:MAG: NADP-dependent oxidoreductase, partial [Gammaproteobacteria bacterium]
MTPINKQVTLAARPIGAPALTDFAVVERAISPPAADEVLCKSLYLSLDPYMRGRMSAAKSYAAPVEIGAVMEGGVVGEVIDSRSEDFSIGDIVMGYGGWQEYFTLPAKSLRKVDAALAPISTALGVLGMPGVTAYTGLLNIGKPQAGETVVVAAASGAVGSVVGQIAKIKGARAVGIAGSERKCRYVVDELGFDACVNHKSDDFVAELKAACPSGIDVYFENVGGHVFKTVLPLLNEFARVPVCGVISSYNDTELPRGEDLSSVILRSALVKRLTIRGFLVFDFAEDQAEALTSLSVWIREGRLKYKEDIVDGL